MAIHKKKSLYPADAWKVVEDSFDIDGNQLDETIFALGNGYIGIRGNFEEGFGGPETSTLNGTYLNGFYDSAPIIHGETAYGLAKNKQTMLNVTDSKIIELSVDGEKFLIGQSKLLSYRRELDMARGVLSRECIWQTEKGSQVSIKTSRLVCLDNRQLAAISYTVEPLNFDGEIVLTSILNAEVYNKVTGGDPRVGSSLAGQVLELEEKVQKGSFAAVKQKTRTTRFALVCAMHHQLHTSGTCTQAELAPEQTVQVQYHVQAKKGQPITLEKFISYYTSKDFEEETLLQRARDEVTAASSCGFGQLETAQKRFLDEFWKQSDIEIEGDPSMQQGIRFNLFHLLQSAGRDGRTNIAAKGVTGEGYEGHYFWDTEIYVLPSFLFSHPEVSKSLLMHRYKLLDKARDRAAEMAEKGALYAWRTIDGEETSAYYPAGTAQYHINADIIYALKRYYFATSDQEFMCQYGAEMLFETSRLWADLGTFSPRRGFCISGVTGPDEYTAVVNNNAYTNFMAKDHLEFAVTIYNSLREKHPEALKAVVDKISLNESEVADWKRAADQMYIHYDHERGIIGQDDSFLDKAPWDFKAVSRDKYPLLLHFHSLVIYRFQVIKQADLLLAMFLLSGKFTLAEKKRNFRFYEPLTTHDSSLSPSVHGILAAEIGYQEKAYEYFMHTARLDLDDIHDNSKNGVHCAAMAGSWMGVVNGFGGMRDIEGVLSFKPVIPKLWNSYSFKVKYRNSRLRISVDKSKVQYELIEGSGITFYHRRQKISLSPGEPITISLIPKLEAVIFDLDGVITDTAEYHYQAWKMLADEIGVHFDRVINDRLRGVGRIESLMIILQTSQREYSESEIAQMAAKKNGYYNTLVANLTPDDILPGIKDLLQKLRTAKLKIGLASASKNAFAVIEKLQVGEYFDVIVDAAKIAKGKPDPEIFLTAAEMLGVDYQDCVGVEDAASGVESIKESNMFSIGIGEATVPAHPDVILKDTTELTLDLIRKSFEGRESLES